MLANPWKLKNEEVEDIRHQVQKALPLIESDRGELLDPKDWHVGSHVNLHGQYFPI